MSYQNANYGIGFYNQLLSKFLLTKQRSFMFCNIFLENR